ncbi:MAG: carbohydrate ABC transporter permease [Anaerolineaceae bacterium]|nr:carbohydrate ABC transporter permease [Anaerolineaceae bacterium]
MINSISGRMRAKKIILILSSVAVLIYILAPIYWVVVSSFQKETALSVRPPYFFPSPGIFSTNHYHFLFTGEVPDDSTAMIQAQYTMSGTLVYPSIINSLIIALAVTAINLLVGFPAGHVFARYRFWGDGKVFGGLMATRLLPSISLLVPMYILMQQIDWIDTKRALVCIYAATTIPFTIWILRSYFKNLPVEYEEAARMDGCNYLSTLVKVVLPIARPGIVAAGIFAFMTSYGEFVFATVLTRTLASKTQTAVLASLAQGMSASRGMIAAAAVLSMLPPMILAIVFRKQVIDGLTSKLGKS